MKIVALLIFALLITSCASMRPVDVAKPSEVTVTAALKDVAEGLNEFSKQGKVTKSNFGLLVDEVTVTLKVTASATDSSKLVVDVANIQPAVLAGGVAGVNLTQEAGSAGTRDNTIVVKLKNVYTAQLNSKGQGAPVNVKPDGTGTIGPVTISSQPGLKFEIDCKNPKTDYEKAVCTQFKSQ